MLELVAAVSAASTAFNTIKKMVATGREIHDVGTQIADWYGHIADATEGIREANDPPLHKKLLGNPEQLAVQALVQKKKSGRTTQAVTRIDHGCLRKGCLVRTKADGKGHSKSERESGVRFEAQGRKI